MFSISYISGMKHYFEKDGKFLELSAVQEYLENF